jgi:hypothetical protein
VALFRVPSTSELEGDVSALNWWRETTNLVLSQ